MSVIETPDWSEDNVIKYIEMIEDNQLLWNTECSKTNGSFRVDTLNEIAQEMKLPCSEVHRKWEVVICFFLAILEHKIVA
jgi:hypothetical protein